SRAASTTAETFKDFYVYGYQGTPDITWESGKPTLLMDSVKVIKTGDVWEAVSPTPWPAAGTHVQFFAFSPAEGAASGIGYANDETTNKPVLSFTAQTDVTKQVDLLYAQSGEMEAAATGEHKKVELAFIHALTKVKFSAKVQPNQKLFISELSLHNLGKGGSFAYTTGESVEGKWNTEVAANDSFAIVLSAKAGDGITETEAVDVTATDCATLVIPQERTKVDVSVPKAGLFTGNTDNSYIKMVYSLKSETTTGDWIVGKGPEAENQRVAYIPVDVAFNMNQVVNYVINFGTGNGGYDDDGNPIVNSGSMIHFDTILTDWDEETPIDPTPPADSNIPDKAFANCLKAFGLIKDDPNKAGWYIATPSGLAVEQLMLMPLVPGFKDVESFEGVEVLSNLVGIQVMSANVVSVDFSKCSKLEGFSCSDMPNLESVVLTNLPSLELVTIDNAPNLSSLNCSGSVVKSLSIENTPLTNPSAMLAPFNSLESIYLNNCSLTTLDLSKHLLLNSVDCRNNGLTELNIGSLNLKTLSCFDNKLSNLNVEHCTSMTNLNCANNNIETLTLSSSPLLKHFSCVSNKLKDLDLSSNVELVNLECDKNQLGELNITTLGKLSTLFCGLQTTDGSTSKKLGLTLTNDQNTKWETSWKRDARNAEVTAIPVR
ncbi:MAG: fimbrillin family protein, partial [Phocaeicola sp.]